MKSSSDIINDRYPKATTEGGQLQTERDWIVIPTSVGKTASIGSGAVILCGIKIGEGSIIGARSVVTKNVSPYEIVAGNPAKFIKKLEDTKNNTS